MPRDGSNIYSQPFPDVVEDTTIESTVYNGFTNDIAADLNAARPIVAGGTGATNAHDAMIALSGEIAKQQVTNFDSHPWVNGSFYSDAGATAAPTVDAYTGIYYEHNNTQYATIEARKVDGGGVGALYVRQKIGGVWSAWAEHAGSVAGADARYVNVTGDIMSGALAVNNVITSALTATTGTYYFGSSGTKFLTYDGTNFTLAGGAFSTTSYISATGDVLTGAATPNTGTFRFGNNGTKYLNCDGTNFNLGGGPLYTSTVVAQGGGVWSQVTPTTGTYYFGNTGTKYLTYDGTNFVFAGGGTVFAAAYSAPSINCTNQANFGAITGSPCVRLGNDSSGLYKFLRITTGAGLEIVNNAFTFVVATLSDAGLLTLSNYIQATGIQCRAGVSGVYGADVFNFNWTGALAAWVNNTNIGNVTVTSDYRTKKDVADLPSTWDAVKALRPIKYTQAQFSPPPHIEHIAKQKADKADIPGPLFEADDIERWGFLAHELQATLTPSASTGEKDSPDTIQSPNPFTVIAALTKALQEAMARIEALEAR